MLSVYEQARLVPQLVQMMASGESTEWLRRLGPSRGASSSAAACDDDRVVAEAIYWVATITMGHAMIEAAAPHDLQGTVSQASLDRLEPDDAARVARLIPQFDEIRRDGFTRVVEWAVRPARAADHAR